MMKNSNELKSLKDLPGYPHYNQNEDIYNNEIESDIDPDSITSQKKISTYKKKTASANRIKTFTEFEDEEMLDYVGPLASDNKKDEKDEEDNEISDEEEDMSDGGDDEIEENRVYPVDYSGDELDVPGSELDDENEEIGEEDEENNFYSLGDND